MARWALVGAMVVALGVNPASAAEKVLAERTVARFIDPESGDAATSQRFVFQRELIVEAWLVAFERAPCAPDAKGKCSAPNPTLYDEKSLRTALDRHLIDEVLGSRELPLKHEARVPGATAVAQQVLTDAVGGPERLAAALTASLGRTVAESEMAGVPELHTLVRRRARAEIWLEVAVAPPIEPTVVELAAFQPRAPELIAKAPFHPDNVRRHARAARLREFATTYLQLIRSKLHLEILE